MDNRLGFMHRAIEENQLNIRAIDVKIGALLAAVLLPLAATPRIFAHLENFYGLWPHWSMFVVNMAFLLMWLLALGCLVLAMTAIDNPAVHIPNVKLYKGSFYGGGLFKLSLVDALVNRADVIAAKRPVDYMSELPMTDQDIMGELTFEQMKLAYIRDVKMNRLKWGLRFAGIWLALGICIFLSSHYLAPVTGK
jgi:hypothetical protein